MVFAGSLVCFIVARSGRSNYLKNEVSTLVHHTDSIKFYLLYNLICCIILCTKADFDKLEEERYAILERLYAFKFPYR